MKQSMSFFTAQVMKEVTYDETYSWKKVQENFKNLKTKQKRLLQIRFKNFEEYKANQFHGYLPWKKLDLPDPLAPTAGNEKDKQSHKHLLKNEQYNTNQKLT